MKLLPHPALALFAAALIAAPTAAAQSLRKKVFENCAEALTEVKSLSDPQERVNFIEYLTLVLKLARGVAAPPALTQPQMNLPLEQLRSDTGLIATLDPARERDAKSCAARLLAELSPEALSALPALLQAAGENSTEDDLAYELELQAFKLAALANSTHKTPSADMLAQLTRFYLAGGSQIALNVMFELRPHTLRTLCGALENAPPGEVQRLADGMLFLDRGLEGSLACLTELFKRGQEEVKFRVLSLIARGGRPDPSVLRMLALALPGASNTLEAAVVVTLSELLKAGMPGKEVLPADEAVIQALFAALGSTTQAQKSTIIDLLIGISEVSPLVEHSAVGLVGSKDEGERESALRILAGITKTGEQTFSALVNASYDRNIRVRVSAIRALGYQAERRDAVLSTLSKLLKANSREKADDATRRVLLAAVEALSNLKVGEQAVRLIPYLIEALKIDAEAFGSRPKAAEAAAPHPAIEVLVRIGGGAQAPLFKVLEGKDVEQKKRAIEALAQIRPLPRQLVATLGGALKDPALQSTAAEALIAAGKAAIPEVERLFKKGPASAKLPALRVLSVLGADLPGSEPALLVLMDKVACLPKTQALLLLRPVTPVPPQVERALGQVFLCINEVPVEAVLDAAAKFAPMSENLKDLLHQQLHSASNEIRVRIVGRLPQLGYSPEERVLLIGWLLGEPNESLRLRLIKELGVLGKSAISLKGEVTELKALYKDDARMEDEIVYALYQMDPSREMLEDYALAQFNSDRAEPLTHFFLKLKPEAAIPVLAAALEKLPPAKLPAVLAAAAAFKEEAKELSSRIRPLLSESNPSLAVEALITLLQIDPQRDLVPALRDALVGRYSERVVATSFPTAASPLFEEIERAPGSALAGYNAPRALAR